MAATQQTNFFNTPWSQRGVIERNLIIVGSIGGSIAAAVAIKRAVDNSKARKAARAIERDEETLKKNGQDASYLDTQYNMFADTLYTAMKGVGTDEEAVAGVMYKMKTDVDLLKLVQAFGKRNGYSLTDWIASEFSQEDKSFYVNEVLQRKGLKFRF